MIKRYQTKEMAHLFSEEYKLQKWLYVERMVALVEEQAGIIPQGLSRRLATQTVEPERVHAIEKITNHDVIAFLTAAREKLGKHGKWLHFGMTSYDLVDTAFVLILREGLDVVQQSAAHLSSALKKLARKHKRTVQMGRTHGMFAQPITFGYKVLSWYEEAKRARERLTAAHREISYGKLSGAVGTYTMLSPRIERAVMRKLGLRAEPVSTQVLPRDRFAYLITHLALYASLLERIATEIRNLSRTEIAEVSEPFTKGQKGSSAMPHKKNPITCERISGLARVVRSHLIPAFENINLWHERDITNSSVERIIFPDAFHLVHYLTQKMTWVITNLTVYPDRMMHNIQRSFGTYASQPLMNRLIEAGMDRDDAYAKVQKLSFLAAQKNRELKDLVLRDKQIRKYLNEREVNTMFDLSWYVRHITRRRQ
jgi:adenylosuccinate lyase